MALRSSSKKARAGGVKKRRVVKVASLRRWVRRARGKGVPGPELVFELRVRRGLKLREVAEVLGLGVAEVRELWRESCEARATPPAPLRADVSAVAPRSKGDFAALREHVSVALWETVVETFAVPEVTAEDGDGVAQSKAFSRMVSVRIKALKRMGKLYGLGRKRRGGRSAEFVSSACATPEEIAELVREWRRER